MYKLGFARAVLPRQKDAVVGNKGDVHHKAVVLFSVILVLKFILVSFFNFL